MAFTSNNGRTQTSLAEINITPLVDVVLVLLVITESRVVVTIAKDQTVYLGDQPVNVHDLPYKLRQSGKDPAHQVIYLRADERVPFGAFATVMDAVKQAGITNIDVVTQPLDAKGPGRQ
jgi:biopolymer transport protein TolR